MFKNRRVGETMDPNHIFEKYITYIKNIQQFSPKTVSNRITFIKRFVDSINCSDLSKLTIYELDDYLIERSKTLKPESINTERRILRSYFSFAQEYLKIEMQFSFTQVKEIRVGDSLIETFTPQQIRRVIVKTKNHQDKLMVATMFEAGLRMSELIHLRVEDLSGRKLQVRGKGGKVRLTFVTPRLAQQLESYLHMQCIYTGYMFTNQEGNHFHVDTVRRRIKKAFKSVGLDMHPHQLRHSFATDLLNEGADPRSVQKLLGHANLNTTMRYLQVTDKYLEEVFSKHRKLSVA